MEIVSSSSEGLPFSSGKFDAIVHSDVLCCVEDKLITLQECRRVISAKGTMAFSVIHMSEGASTADMEQAAEAGPLLIAAPSSYPEMLRDAQWRILFHCDVTEEFAAVVRSYSVEVQTRADELCELKGEERVHELLKGLQAELEVLDASLIKRSLFAAISSSTVISSPSKSGRMSVFDAPDIRANSAFSQYCGWARK